MPAQSMTTLQSEDSGAQSSHEEPAGNFQGHPLQETRHDPFSPFFTLIEDTRSAIPHHPTVHYIFCDDDTDLVAEAALRIHDTSLPPNGDTSTALMPDRYVLVTLTEDGRSVATAHGMTGDWQVSGAEIAAAPTLEGEIGGLMLKIEGTEGAGPWRADEAKNLGLEALVEAFRERVEELRKVVENRLEVENDTQEVVALDG